MKSKALFVLLLLNNDGYSAQSEVDHGRDLIRPSVFPLDLAHPPLNKELMSAGQLGGLLYPTHDNPSRDTSAPLANLSFGSAIEAWNRHRYKEAYQLFNEHVQQFPHSPWVGEALLHQGCEARYEGRMNEAEQTYQRIIADNEGKTAEGAKRLLNKARLRMANLKALQNDIPQAQAYYRQLHAKGLDWRERTYASHWLLQLSKIQQDNLGLLDCGTQALGHLLEQAGHAEAAHQVRAQTPKHPTGFSLGELQALAKQHHYDLVGLRLEPGDLKRLPLPAIALVSWRNGKGHYWEIEAWNGDTLELYDPQNQDHYQQTVEEFKQQWHGEILAFARHATQAESLPGKHLALNEMEELSGGCCGVASPADHLGPPDTPGNSCSGTSGPHRGQPVWQVNPVTLNFYMDDTPLWYLPAKGPAIEFKLSYNSQSAMNYHQPFGNKWQLNYNTYLVEAPGGNVTIYLPDGKLITFVKTAQGYSLPARYGEISKLVKTAANDYSLSYPDGTTYRYAIPSGANSEQVFLTRITDAHGNAVDLGYNSSAQLIRVTDADGKSSKLAYNAQGLVTAIADPYGRVAKFTYNADGDLIKLTDMGGIKTSLAYDADKYISSINYGQGAWKIVTEPSDGLDNNDDPYPAPGKKMWENYRVTITSPLGAKEEYYYDGYHGSSWYISARDYLNYTVSRNNYTHAKKTEYAFTNLAGGNGLGVVSSVTTPYQNSQRFGYNAAGKITSLAFDTAPNGTYQYAYNALNNLIRITEPNTNITKFAYAPNGEDLLSATDGRGIQSFEYNATHDLTSLTDRLGNKTAIEYNSHGQPTRITDPQGIVTEYSYNAENRLAQVLRAGLPVSSYAYDDKGRIASKTGPDGMALEYIYDNLDRLVEIDYPDAKKTILKWSAIRPKLLDEIVLRDGRIAKFSYDAEQRVTLDINAENGSSRYEYDKNGNLIRFIDPNSVMTRWTYDLDNRVNRKIYSDDAQEVHTWNSRDLLASWRNARGNTIAYTYDSNANLTWVDYPASAIDTRYTYDKYSRATQRTDALGTFKYYYDANDNLTKIDGPWANDSITYQYDKLNRRVGMAVESGQTLEYGYDNLGRQNRITANGGAYTLAYDGTNPSPQSLLRPNGSVTHYQRDALQRTIQVSNETSIGTVINRHGYTYNDQDLKDSETLTHGAAYALTTPGLTTYQNNRLNQVLKTEPPHRDYLYDKDGNLTQGYTPDGYLFKAAYDAANRLQQVTYTDGGGIARKIVYSYGGDGLVGQIDKYVGTKLTEQTRLVRDGFLVVQELDGLNGNSVKRQYVWQNAAQGGIGRLLALLENGHRYDYVYDDNGNVMALLDEAQNVVATYTYSPFGQVQTASGVMAGQPMRFSTKYYDPDTGLSDFGYRFYRADVGKWLNRDPIGERGGVNLYTYIKNTPINSLDPYGLEDWHKDRNLHNRCPLFKPSPEKGDKEGYVDTKGNKWRKREKWESKEHKGDVFNRRDDVGGEYECEYTPDKFDACGGVLDRSGGTYNYAPTTDYLRIPHGVVDYFPHKMNPPDFKYTPIPWENLYY